MSMPGVEPLADTAAISTYSSAIKQWEINKGGWRYDRYNEPYFIPWPLLVEYEAENDTINDDEEFWDWFAGFIAKHSLTRGKVAEKRGSAPLWSGADGWKTSKASGGSLSSWWAKDVFRSWGSSGSSANVERLAVTLQAVRSVIRVVDDSIPPMVVEWDTDGGSYTDFKGQRIHINPKPVTDGGLSDGQAIDITTGFALHEAGHSQYSRGPYKSLIEPTEVKPMRVGGTLLNIIEDVRIEAAVAADMPGFKGYFDAALAWVWQEQAKHLPAKYGPDLKSKLGVAILACRWEADYRAHVTNPDIAREIDWWTAWRDRYISGSVGPRQSIDDGIAHLALDPETKDELDAAARGEEIEKNAARAAGELTKKLTELAKGVKGLPGACHGGPHDKPLDASTAERVSELIDQEMSRIMPTVPAPSGMRSMSRIILHPTETTQSKRRFIGKPHPVLQRLRAALVFRQELPRQDDRLLKSGTVDDEEVWRWGARDWRIFHEERIISRPKVQMNLLVDMSGSMLYSSSGPSKLRIAQELAQLLLFATKDMHGVHTKVYGHTGDSAGMPGPVVYRIWEEGEPLTRLGLLDTLPHHNNFDGYAIEECVQDLLKRGESSDQRVVIVLSDGYPAGGGYGGSLAETHVRSVVDWAEKRGVTVIQIAIDESLRLDDQARMFKHFVPYESHDRLPSQLTKLLSRIV